MRKLNLTLAVLALTTLALLSTTPADAQTNKKYLTLGANPENPGRQPSDNEELIIAIDEVCDSGWGTGNGTRVAGCYSPKTAYIQTKDTKVITAVAFCGNTPTDRHEVAGKIFTLKGLTPQLLQALVTGRVLLTLDGTIRVEHGGTVTHVHKYERAPDRFDGWCDIWSDAGCTALAVVGAAAIVGAATDWYGLAAGDDDIPAHVEDPIATRPPGLQVEIVPGKNGRVYLGFGKSF